MEKLSLMVLIIAGNIHGKKGPQGSIYPCGFCQSPVTWEHNRATACDRCSVWYHTACLEQCSVNVSLLQRDHVSWKCCGCDSMNIDTFSYHSYQMEISNRFELLTSRETFSSVGSYASIPSTDSSFSPSVFSSPKLRLASDSSTNDSKEMNEQSDQLFTKKKDNFRVLLMDCQSIRNKKSQLNKSIEYVKSDAIVGCESGLGAEHKEAEIFPDGYKKNIFRKDRNKSGGGVFICVHDKFNTTSVENGENDCELQWAEIQTKSKSVILGSYYRKPNADIKSLLDLKSSVINVTEKCRDKPLFLAGDFNLPHIDWESNDIIPGGPSAHSQELLELSEEFGMEQMQTNTTRENNNLDLFFTNHPSLVKSCNTIPGISDHGMVVVDIELKPHYNRPKRREIFTYKKQTGKKLETLFRHEAKKLLKKMNTLKEKWQKFKSCINEIVNQYVPKRLTSKRHNLAWLTKTEKKMIVKKHKLYQYANKFRKRADWKKFKQHKNKTQRAVRQTHWNYVNLVLNTSLETGNNKPFWNYIKSKRTDNIGVSGIKCGDIFHQDSKSKANILNPQFKSVFTTERKLTNYQN